MEPETQSRPRFVPEQSGLVREGASIGVMLRAPFVHQTCNEDNGIFNNGERAYLAGVRTPGAAFMRAVDSAT